MHPKAETHEPSHTTPCMHALLDKINARGSQATLLPVLILQGRWAHHVGLQATFDQVFGLGRIGERRIQQEWVEVAS